MTSDTLLQGLRQLLNSHLKGLMGMDLLNYVAARRILQARLDAGSIVIHGRPGSGKDTQCLLLADIMSGAMFSGGDYLREVLSMAEVDADALLGPGTRSSMESGDLVPSDVFRKVILPRLGAEEYKGRPLFLSGLGRVHGEEPDVLAAAQSAGHPVLLALHIEVSEDQALSRLMERANAAAAAARADDGADKLNQRFAEFNAKTLPVLAYYLERNMLVTLDGLGLEGAVHVRLVLEVARYLERSSNATGNSAATPEG